MRITEKIENGSYKLKKGQEIYGEENGIRLVQIVGEYEDVKEALGRMSLINYLKGISIDMEGKNQCRRFLGQFGEELNFRYSGAYGIYVLDHVAFRDFFDENGDNDWDKSSGKKKLQEWAEKNLTKEILEQFEVDLPTAEEVFSQKQLNLYESSRKLKSKQFPIFQNSDNRMMELDGKPIWWWTKSPNAGRANTVWSVYPDGGMTGTLVYGANGFVPVLRRK